MAFQKKTREERGAEVRALLKQIEEGIAKVKTGADWANMLKSRAAFHRYSFSNQLLIAMQRPGAIYVAGFESWKKLGRSVRKGEKAIRILAPIPFKRTEIGENGSENEVRGMWFKTVCVFDYAQTDAIPGRKAFVPPQLLGRVEDPEAKAEEIFRQLAEHAQNNLKIPVTLELCRDGIYGYFSAASRRIVISSEADPAHRPAILAHEIAHATLHAEITDYHAHRGRYEVEAESVAFCVMHAAGIDSREFSFPYVATWADRGGDVRESMERISKGVTQILAGLGAETVEGETVAEEAAA